MSLSVEFPCAPPPPTAAVQRQRRKQYSSSIHEAAELHELHRHLPELVAPWKEACLPMTVLCMGRTQLDQRCPIMNPRHAHGIRGIFASWMKELIGDGALLALEAFTADLGSSAPSRSLGRWDSGGASSALQALESFVGGVSTPSFVAVRLELQSHWAGACFTNSALWLDLGVDELLNERSHGLQSVEDFLASRSLGSCCQLLEQLLPALQRQQVMKLVICGPPDDPAVGAARARTTSLLRDAPDATRSLQLTSLTSSAQGTASNALATAFQELRSSDQTTSLSEFISGEVRMTDFGFPGHVLPTLPQRYQVTNQDRVMLHLAAESALDACEAKGWIASAPGSFIQLADAYEIPQEALSTSSARTFARSQNQQDPLVCAIARLRDDVAYAVALLPLCAVHPFNMIRVLQLGGIHSLLALLADSSTLAPEVQITGEELSNTEVSALVLLVLCASRQIRRFLVSQGIFELLAVAIRHPNSERQLHIFCALLVRLLRADPEHHGPRTVSQLSQPLAEKLLELLSRPESSSASAVAAAAAALAPPLEVFAPAMPQLLRNAAPEAFKALAASLTLDTSCMEQLNVPRLLSMMPVDPPKGLVFHHGALAALSLCSRTAALTSLCRPWVVSTAMALLRSLLSCPTFGLRSVRVALPLAAAQEERVPPMCAFTCEVEEKIQMQKTFGSTWRTATPPDDTAGRGGPPLRKQRLLGWAELRPWAQLPASPNAKHFQERPQLRVEIVDDHTELFLALSLLPVSKCLNPCFALDEGQMGFWICECPEELRDQRQLDLKAPIHVSASEASEHLISVALPKGLYTVVPFSSHQIVTDAVTQSKTKCRGQSCGCIDLNLHQETLYDLGTRFVYLSMWGEATDLPIQEAAAWFQRLRVEWPLLMALPLWLIAEAPTEVLLCITGPDDDECLLRGSEPCMDLWPLIPHRRVRNERTGALRIHIPRLQGNLRISCLWQEPLQTAKATPQLLVYSSSKLEIFCPRSPGGVMQPGCCDMPRELCNFWQSSALCAGQWTSGFASGFGSLRNPQVVLEVLRGPSRGEELQLDIYLCIPAGSLKDKDAPRPKVALTVFVRQEEPERRPSAPQRLAEGVLRREIGRSKTTLGGYVLASLSLSGAESRQELFCVLQNAAPQETWPWQLRVLARIRAKDGEAAGEAGCSQPMGVPEEPPLRCAVLGGVAEPGRIHTCWPEAVGLYSPKQRPSPSRPQSEEEELVGASPEYLSYAWMCEEEWKYQMPEVSVSGGFLAQRALPQPLPAWPAPEPLPQLEVEEQVDVTSMLVPPKVQVDPDDTPERTTPVLQPPNTRRKPAVPLPPKRLVIRSRNENDGVDADQADVDGADVTGAHHWAAIHREAFAPPAPASQLERQKRMEHLLRRRKHGRERIMPEDFYRENLQRQQATSLPPRRRDAREQGEEEAPRSARGLRSGSPSLPPIDQAEVREERCCNFAKHPLLCCQGTSQAQKAPRHVVRLERRPGMERLGFGNVVAGPRDAPVLVISWIREGALGHWNATAPEGMAVPVQSAIVSVNGVSQDVPRMREELRSQVVEMEIMAPERWRYTKVTHSA